jgi:hypothetical protein
MLIFFEKIVKTEGGHRALGSPRAGSVSARVQQRLPLSLQGSCDVQKHGNREVFSNL